MSRDYYATDRLQAYLSTGEAARVLGVHPTAVWQMVKNRRLPAMRVGKNWIISREALLEFALDYQKGPGRHRPKGRKRRKP